ncbi:hypothetical protein [Paenibacillus oryzisoli]|nr:hypothetical protein [Paenibacillus oryzisoli]
MNRPRAARREAVTLIFTVTAYATPEYASAAPSTPKKELSTKRA